MLKKRTAKIVPGMDGKAHGHKMPSAADAASKPKTRSTSPAGFENKAGRYELIRVEGDQAYYSFTNLQGRTVDAVMSVTMWRRMAQRADTTLKEIA